MHYSVYLFSAFLFIHIFCKAAHATCVSEIYLALPCFLKTTMKNYPTWKFQQKIKPPRFTSKLLLLSFKNEVLDISCNITTKTVHSSSNWVEKSEEELKVNSAKDGFKIVYIPNEELTFRGSYDAYGTAKNTTFVAVNGTFNARLQHPRQILTYENVKLNNNSQFIDLSSASVTYEVVPRYSGPALFYDIKLANETEDTESLDIIKETLHRLFYRSIFLENVNGTSMDVSIVNRYLQESFQTTPVTKILECWKCRTDAAAHHADMTDMKHSGNMRLSYSISILVAVVGLSKLLLFYHIFY